LNNHFLPLTSKDELRFLGIKRKSAIPKESR